MAVFKPNKVAAMPGTPGADEVYFVKGGGDPKFKMKITNSSGTAIDLDAVTDADLTSALATKANDSDVVKLTGAQTVSGAKTFSASPVVPTPTSGTDAANKNYVDTGDSNLQTQITNLSTTVTNGLGTPTDLNCSSNPNYPAASAGNRFQVTGAGKVGGASGVNVEVGDMIVCKTTSAGGTQAAEGAKFYILEGNRDVATTATTGIVRLATQAEAEAGTNTVAALTPKTGLDLINTVSVKYNASQSLTSPQKTQARTNIGAADDAAVVHLAGNESISGVKAFAASPLVPTVGQGDNSTRAASTAYVDTAVAAVAGSATLNWNAGAAVGW